MNNRAHLFIIAAPSGAGKTSLVRALLSEVSDIKISVSHTTRPARPVEREGQDYFFVDDAEFAKLVEQEVFLEHAGVHAYHYGTSREWVLQQLQQGIDVILEIDWQGAQQIHKLFPQSVSIFILPPSMEVLEHRLQQRKQDKPEVIAGRMRVAREEIAHSPEFDYILVNDDFAQAVKELVEIVLSVRNDKDVSKKDCSALLVELLK